VDIGPPQTLVERIPKNTFAMLVAAIEDQLCLHALLRPF
jgi:hypothetical protein